MKIASLPFLKHAGRTFLFFIFLSDFVFMSLDTVPRFQFILFYSDLFGDLHWYLNSELTYCENLR